MFYPRGFRITDLRPSSESQEYKAATFKLNEWNVVFRLAKITPRKVGQFVTLWKRNSHGKTSPFDNTDAVDFFIIEVVKDQHVGHFVFPKALLLEKGYVANHGNGGKRAMRVYPVWDEPQSAQAKRTQTWQLPYFFAAPGRVCSKCG